MEIKEKIELKLSGYKPPTQANRRCILNRFLEHAGEKNNYDEYDAIKFLQKCSYSQASKIQAYNVLLWFYRHILECPINDKLPRPDKDQVKAPILTHDQVRDMIMGVKIGAGDMLQGIMALSSTYGCRRKELCSITPEHIDLKKKQIYIQSAKGGMSRWMHLPDEIHPQMEGLKNNYYKTNLTAISQMFQTALKRGAVPHQGERIGWHSVRYRVILEITQAEINDYNMICFFRWSQADSRVGILYRYRSMAGDDELIEKVDKPIFDVHPFLQYWAE